MPYKPSAERKTCAAGRTFDMEATHKNSLCEWRVRRSSSAARMMLHVKSAFALLLTKVTKPSGEIYGGKGEMNHGNINEGNI